MLSSNTKITSVARITVNITVNSSYGSQKNDLSSANAKPCVDATEALTLLKLARART